jgi:hypothetical protein
MSGMMQSADITAEGVADALQLAGDTLRLTTAPPDQLNAAAAFLGKALVQFEQSSTRDECRFDAVQRIEAAGKAIGAEMRRGRSTRNRRRLRANARDT